MVTQQPEQRTGLAGFSLDPDDFERGGGLPSKYDGVILAAEIDSECDYGGRSQIQRTALVLRLGLEVGEDYSGAISEGAIFDKGILTFDEFYSAGNTYRQDGTQQFAATNDGKNPAAKGRGIMPLPEGRRHGLNESANLGFLTKSFREAENRAKVNVQALLRTNDVLNLVGLKCHWERRAAPKLEGVSGGGQRQRTDASGQTVTEDRQILVPVIIIAAGQASATRGTALAAATPRAATPRAAAPRAAAARPAAPAATPPAPSANGAVPPPETLAVLMGIGTKIVTDSGGLIAKNAWWDQYLAEAKAQKMVLRYIAMANQPGGIEALGLLVEGTGADAMVSLPA
jgi:hypothetical protein